MIYQQHGCESLTCGESLIYNNTLITDGGGNCIVIGPRLKNTIKNNIMVGCNGIAHMYGADFDQTFSDDNVGYNMNTWASRDVPYVAYNLAQYQTAYSRDLNSTSGNPLLDANDRLQVGSSAIGTGVNLTSLGITALNSDKDGNSRPASGAWDIGAYEYTLLRGDLDGDGAVTLADLRLLLSMLLGQTAVNLPAADLDGNGQLGLGDVRALLELLVSQ